MFPQVLFLFYHFSSEYWESLMGSSLVSCFPLQNYIQFGFTYPRKYNSEVEDPGTF